MAVLIFRLRNVPDDEAEDVRELLEQHAVEFYETDAGNWGIAMPGIWVADDETARRARQLIERYQSERAHTQRQHFDAQQAKGMQVTLLQRITEHPLRAAGIFLFCLFILYVSIHPFLQMIEFSRR